MRLQAMFYAVMLLGALAVVEAIQRAHQIAGDAANALEGLRAKIIAQFYLLAIHRKVDMAGFLTKRMNGALDIGINLRLLQLAP